MKRLDKKGKKNRKTPDQARPSFKPNVRRKKAPEKNEPKQLKRDKSESNRRLIKWLKTLGNVLITCVVTGAVVWIGFVTYRHVTTSSYFALSTIDINGTRRLTETELLTSAGLASGQNIFAVDLQGAEQRLVADPWIVSAQVKRHLPRRLTIDVQERQAVAMVIFDVPYLVDDAGDVFKRWVHGDPMPAPVLTGITRQQFSQDMRESNEIIRDAIALAKRYHKAGLSRALPLAEIHREVEGGFSLVVGAEPFYVRFGRGPYRTKLKRLGRLYAQMQRDGDRPSIVYFDNEKRPDRVTVKLKSEREQSDGSSTIAVPDKIQKRVSKI